MSVKKAGKGSNNKAVSKRKGQVPAVVGLDPVISETEIEPAGSEKTTLEVQEEVTDTLTDAQWEIAERICLLIEETPKGLDHICGSDDSLVSARTFHRWLEANLGLRQRYARSKDRQAEFLVFQALDIADDQSGDTIVGERGLTQDSECVARARLRVDTRKWLAGKLNPKKWGDKLDVTSNGESIAKTRVIRPAAPDG